MESDEGEGGNAEALRGVGGMVGASTESERKMKFRVTTHAERANHSGFCPKWVRAKLIKEHRKGLRSVLEKEMSAEPFCRTAKRRMVLWAKSNSGFKIQDGDFSEMRRFVMQKALWI